jgi:hypothetical protein
MRKFTSVIVVLVLTLVSVARAQEVKGIASAKLLALQTGEWLRVQLHDRPSVEGWLVHASDSAVVLRFSNEDRLLRIGTRDRVWTRRSVTGKAIVIGAVIGAAMTVALAHGPCEQGSEWPCSRPLGVVALTGATVGGLVGAMVGRRMNGWRQVHP